MTARECIIPVFVPHLGCPYHCIFCNQNRISGADQPATPQMVIDIIKAADLVLPHDKKRQLAFYGGSFTAIPGTEQEALLTAAEECRRAGLIHSVRLSTRPDAIDDTILGRLKKYGVETIELGAQSMCDEVLELSGRGHTSADVVRSSESIQKAGFRLILQMMTGLPGDTPSRSIDTARRIIALQPDGVRIYPTVIVKDTALYDCWRKGTYSEHTVDDAVELCAQILPMFEEAGIPVIRLGLNPTEELSGGDAAAGAYHPALGELVRSRIMLNRAEKVLEGIECGSSVEIGVNPSRVSQMTGQHRGNLSILTEKFALKRISVKAVPDLKPDDICLISVIS